MVFQNSFGSTWAKNVLKVLWFCPTTLFTHEAFAIQRVKRIYPKSHSKIVPEREPKVKPQDSQFGPLFLICAGFLYQSESQQFPALKKMKSRKVNHMSIYRAGKLITCPFIEARAGLRKSNRGCWRTGDYQRCKAISTPGSKRQREVVLPRPCETVAVGEGHKREDHTLSRGTRLLPNHS